MSNRMQTPDQNILLAIHAALDPSDNDGLHAMWQLAISRRMFANLTRGMKFAVSSSVEHLIRSTL